MGQCSSVFITYAKMPLINTLHADILSKVRSLNFSLSIYLHPILYAIDKGLCDLKTHLHYLLIDVKSTEITCTGPNMLLETRFKEDEMSKNMVDGIISHSETCKQAEGISKMIWALMVLFDLILYVPSTIFQL